MKKKLINFWRRWNGGALAPVALILFLVINWSLGQFTGENYSLAALAGIVLVFLKAVIAEFIGSMLLYFNQPEYFKVINDQDEKDLELKYKTQSWRESAFKFYALYCFGAFLLLAFV